MLDQHTRQTDRAITVRTYEQLEQYASGFTARRFHLLAVISSGGLGKTQLFKTRLRPVEHLYVDGHVTAFGLYKDLYEHRNLPVILDDADTLFRSPAFSVILKPLCDLVKVRTLRWKSRAAESDLLPNEFQTTSPVVILTNAWNSVDSNMRAVADRGVVLLFKPSAADVHQRVIELGVVSDPEILKFFESHLSMINVPSIRMYLTAQQIKSAGITDWQGQVHDMLVPTQEARDLLFVAELLAADFETEDERVKQFVAKTGRSPATYYRYRKTLLRARGNN